MKKPISLTEINNQTTVTELQTYVQDMVKRRGFDNESPQDIMLLMMEEVGELAKAIRKESGIQTDENKRDAYPEIKGEIADVFIYILSLANTLDISLVDAFKEKEQVNEKRVWS